MLHFCFGVSSVSEEGMKVFVYLWSPWQTAPARSVGVSHTCICAWRVMKRAPWHCCLLINLGILCPQMSQIQLCIAHIEFFSLSWKLKLKFAVSAWIFSLSASWTASMLYQYTWYLEAEKKIKVNEFQKNLGVSVLVICPCSLWKRSSCIVPTGTLRVAEYFVSRQGTVSKIGISYAVGSLKPLANGCVLFSLNTAEEKFSPSDFESKI